MYSAKIPSGNYNLKGLSFTNSIYTRFAEMVLAAEEGDIGMWYMADNLFCAQKHGGRVKWISVDGVKMENSHHRDDVTEYMRYIRSQYADDERTRTFLDIYEAIMIATMVDAKAYI